MKNFLIVIVTIVAFSLIGSPTTFASEVSKKKAKEVEILKEAGISDEIIEKVYDDIDIVANLIVNGHLNETQLHNLLAGMIKAEEKNETVIKREVKDGLVILDDGETMPLPAGFINYIS